jgi:DNA-directed RNA polymerase specialized sigma24 family protein
MDALEVIVTRARDGDAEAFGTLVRRFQDMAVGYGYSILHDFQLAEDAAQEAFFEAYRTLSKLREPAAFAGWFGRIVFKQCDRITRRRVVATVPLEASPVVSGFSRTSGEEEER